MSARSLNLISTMFCAMVLPVSLAKGQPNADNSANGVDWPDTPAARWAKAYVEAYNTPGEDALQQFIKDHFSEAELRETPVERMVAEYFQPRRMGLEKLQVHSVTAEGDFVAAVIAPAKPYGWLKFRFELSPDPPHGLIHLRIGPTPAPDAEASAAPDYHDWKDLEDLLEQVRRDSGAPGMAAAVVQGGRVIETATAGVRRMDRPDRVQTGDRFHIGSVAKSFTATMIGKLVEDGVLRWDTTIGEALPDISMSPGYRAVTLEALLQHRGGVPPMPSATKPTEGTSLESKRSPADARDAAIRQVLTEPPSKLGEYAYSNMGYVVAAYMAERVAKQPWETLMRRSVFEPLGLTSVGFGWPATEEAPDQPRGHYGTPPDLKVDQAGDHALVDLAPLGPAGDLSCDVEDLARFAAFHLQGLHGQDGVLKADTVRRLHRPADGGHYMGGWVIRDSQGWHGHEGTAGTFFAEITLYPDKDLAIVALANCGPSVEPFLEKMKEAVLERRQAETLAPGAAGEVEWPDTIAARRAKAFLEAMNAGGTEALRRFVAENFSPASLEEKPVEARVTMFEVIRSQTGRLVVQSVRPKDELGVVVMARCDPSGIWVELTITMKNDAPHYWAGVRALPTLPP